jgi:hypothetical protein
VFDNKTGLRREDQHLAGDVSNVTYCIPMYARLFTLLVVAGDVESNPGPTGRGTSSTRGYTQSQLSFRDKKREEHKFDRILDRLDGIG